jgi:hypothetical protein
MRAAHQYYLYQNRATVSSHSKATAPFVHSIEMTDRLQEGLIEGEKERLLVLFGPQYADAARELLGQTRRVLSLKFTG